MHPTVRRLLRWYRTHKRDLPWRRTRDPYRLFISELMLQQTQVERVKGFYVSWIKKFPNWKSLATTDTSDLIHAWAGLGYNRRALFAREAAKQVLARGVPQNEEAWSSLKGVGPYMAAALTEFVNHTRALVIDTNVRRVAGRIFHGIPFPSPKEDAALRRTLEKMTPQRVGHVELPQAFMDLGSTLCLPAPHCLSCPMKGVCRARKIFYSAQGTAKAVNKPKRISRETIREGKKYPDRIYRGKILKIVRERGALPIAHVGHAIDPEFQLKDQTWVEKMVERMAKDGLVQIQKNHISLPSK
jgi:A/G-specific adenine glycosylase